MRDARYYQEIADVKAFQKKFGIPFTEVPTLQTEHIRKFRSNFLLEEAIEYSDAVKDGDMVKMFDALIDTVYVALGNSLIHGFPWRDGWSVVHACNMKKKRAESLEETKRGTMFDIIKPPGWESPEETLKHLIDSKRK